MGTKSYFTSRIYIVDRIVVNIRIQINPAVFSNGVSGEPATQFRIVGAVVGQE